MIFIVVVSCHFERDGNGKLALCTTTKARVRQALTRGNTYAGQEVYYVATGNVPYTPDQPTTLSGLIRKDLVRRGIPNGRILTGEGVGIFSEARTITRDIRAGYGAGHRLEIVSSGWYLWTARQVWRRRAREQGLVALFDSVRGTGGVKTHAFYAVYGAAVTVAAILGQEKRLEVFMIAKQARRKTEGFNWDGCG